MRRRHRELGDDGGALAWWVFEDGVALALSCDGRFVVVPNMLEVDLTFSFLPIEEL